MDDPRPQRDTQSNDERSKHLRALALAGALATLGAFGGLAASTQGKDAARAGGQPPGGFPAGQRAPLGQQPQPGQSVQDPSSPQSQDPFGQQAQDPFGGQQDPTASGGFFDPTMGGPSGSALGPGGQMPSAPSMSGPS